MDHKMFLGCLSKHDYIKHSNFHSENSLFTVLFTKGIRKADATDYHGNCVTQATLPTNFSHVNAQVTSDICGVPLGGLLIFPPNGAELVLLVGTRYLSNDWRLLKSRNQIKPGSHMPTMYMRRSRQYRLPPPTRAIAELYRRRHACEVELESTSQACRG